MIRRITFLVLMMLTAVCTVLHAQSSHERRKMSSMVRMAARSASSTRRAMGADKVESPHICALIRIKGKTRDAHALLAAHGGRALRQWSDIYAADIPIDRLYDLAACADVERIEAHEPCSIMVDVAAEKVGVNTVREGTSGIPAFDGTGVVIGIEDIGFDLTHPNFYSRDFSRYRIQRFWDQLSTDTLNSTFVVGRDYVEKEELLALQHSMDGLHQTHGTHTAGIAAGGGAEGPEVTSPYIGMAPEADLCLVANATSNNVDLINKDILYKYTNTVDLLGFQYIFDYAQSVGKPCVISFSEGHHTTMYEEEQLYFRVLDEMVGPGRIIVSAAGNEGRENTYLHKEASTEKVGTFISAKKYFFSLLRSYDPHKNISTRIKFYVSGNESPLTYTMTSQAVYETPDSLYSDTLVVDGKKRFAVTMGAYPNCYEPEQTSFELLIEDLVNGNVGGSSAPVSVELMGEDTEIEMFKYVGNMVTNTLDPTLNNATNGHCILAPSCSESVISVGVSIYRTGVINYWGEWKHAEEGTNGERSTMSSMGPTLDGRIKPDVMAPGCNVISSYSTWYLENHPGASDTRWDVRHFEYEGRTYPWNSNSGTSMSSPVVGGIIALWLQAKPTLTPQEAMEAIAATSRHHDPSLTYPNNVYGYGEIDAYKGLLYVLELDKTGIISTRNPHSAQISQRGNSIFVRLEQPTLSPAWMSVYSMTGQKVHESCLATGQSTYTVPLPPLASGVYAVQLNTGCPDTTGSSLIRIK